MGWLFPILFAVLVLAGLKLSGRLSRTALELAVVAALVGLAGYAWQGSPSLAGSPVTHATTKS
jgi:cytochrome c-type biogenesis protein CcmH